MKTRAKFSYNQFIFVLIVFWNGDTYDDYRRLICEDNAYANNASEWENKFFNAQQYLNAANDLLNRNGSKIYQFTSADGWLFKYDQIKNEFLLISSQGTISTFFRPINGLAYWLEQVAKYGSK